MTFNKRTIGADKEQLAAEYLIDNGYTVLERNFRPQMLMCRKMYHMNHLETIMLYRLLA